ncbi:MAG: hypothetical protein ACKVRP_09705, partial [Bacteroidota bacterium]
MIARASINQFSSQTQVSSIPRRFGFPAPILITFLVIFSISSHQFVQAQTRDELRQRAGTELSKMTDEEIDKKLKELGLTREEGLRRASEL